VEAAKQFVDQVAYIEVVAGLNEKAADLTLATGYRDGAVKNYLTKQKPGSAPLLSEIEDQPYFVAFGCHMPGNDAPFADYVFDKMESVMTAPKAPAAGTPGAPGGANAGPGGEKPATANAEKPASANAEKPKAALKAHRELYRKAEGWNMALSFSPTGLKMAGDYFGSDPDGILKLVKETMTAPNPFMAGAGGGASYEAKGTKKIGSVTVEEMALKLDQVPPGGDAVLKQFLGENPRVLLGVAGGRMRMCMGTDGDAEKVFSGKVGKPLSSSQYVKEAMEGLPAKRNVVLLIDPAGVIPMIAPMLGGGPVEAVAPGPPAAISASLSGEPARLDIHVPISTIERIKQAVSPSGPM
jgi:hypothetical protein